MIEAFFDKLLEYYDRPDVRHKVQTVVLDPVVVYIGSKLWPIFLGMMIGFLVIVIMMAYIIYIAMKLNAYK